MARFQLTSKTTAWAAGATLLVTLILCGIGLKLSSLQQNNVGGILLDVERRAADSTRAELERALGGSLDRILGALAGAGTNAEGLRRLQGSEPLVGAAFVIDPAGHLVTPLLGEHSGRPGVLPGDEGSPGLLETALRAAHGPPGGPAPLQALAAASGGGEMLPERRLRARALELAYLARHGEAGAAVAGYAALFREEEQLLLAGSSPSYLELTVARADALDRTDRQQEGTDVLEAAFRRLASGEIAPTLAEERVFLKRLSERLSRRGEPVPEDLVAYRARVEERKATLALFESLRDYAAARARLEPPLAAGERPRRLLELRPAETQGGEPTLLVWARFPPDQGRPAAAGFRVPFPALVQEISRGLAATSTSPLEIRVAPPPPSSEWIELSAFQGDLGFLRLGLPRARWELSLGKARHPFLVTGILTALLTGLVALGLLVVLHGVRRELALSRMKTELVANVSHELKTPLALIRLFGETLLLGRGDPQSREKYCRIITRESERLTHLISSVLSFASIEAGKKTYDLAPVDLVRVASETYESYRFHLEAEGFTHRFEAPEGEASALADANAVAEALINLLENAVKYSKEQKDITLRVSAGPNEVLISVADRGVGISPEDQKKVFEDYYRTREARALGTRGSGLGLSLVSHIMKAHRGRVELRSVPGEGSELTLVFPAAVPPRSAEVGPSQTPVRAVALEDSKGKKS